jgi:hypothetical protein
MTEAEVLRRGSKAARSAALIEKAVRLYEQKGNIVSAAKARSQLEELTSYRSGGS